MKSKVQFHFAVANLKRRKLRAILTIIGISIAIGAMFFMLNSAQSIKDQAQEIALKFSDQSQISVSPKSDSSSTSTSTQWLTDQTVEKIKKINGVKSAYPTIVLPSWVQPIVTTATSDIPVYISGQLLKQKNQSNDLATGNGFTDNNQPGAIISQKVADDQKLKVGSIIQIEEQAPTQTANSPIEYLALSEPVIGIIKNTNIPSTGFTDDATASIEVSYATMQKLLAAAPSKPNNDAQYSYEPDKGQYYEISVYVSDISQVRNIQSEIDALGVDTSSALAIIDSLNRGLLYVQAVLAAFGLIGILIALTGITNTMFMAVLERTREIGILKALGASNGDIQSIFIGESGLLGLSGAVVGIIGSSILGYILAWAGNLYIKNQLISTMAGAGSEATDALRVHYTISPLITLTCVSFSIVVAMLAAYLPARQAARLDPVKALRYE